MPGTHANAPARAEMNSGGDTGNAPRPVDMIICDIIENAAAPERPTGLQVEQPQRPQRSRAKRRPGQREVKGGEESATEGGLQGRSGPAARKQTVPNFGLYREVTVTENLLFTATQPTG